jgi:hypothetical protein
MTDQQHADFTIKADVSYALWPGDGNFCARLSAAPFVADLFWIVDRGGRVSELRPYRFGAFEGRR